MTIQSPSLELGAPLVQPIAAPGGRGYWQSVRRRLRRDPVTLVCAGILILLVASALAAPWLGLADPYKTSMIRRLYPLGSPGHLLGTDELGRDMLSRLIYGGRLSLFMGVTPVLCALLIGGLLGITAGFLGGRVNMAIMRVMDVFYAFPSVLLAISLSGAMGAGAENTLLSLTLVFIPPVCRVSESVTTQVRGFDFVDAARASGASTLTIVRVHVLGNVLGPILVYATSPDQRGDHPGRRPLLPRPGRQAARAGMGPDAEHAAPGDLRQSRAGSTARRDDLHHLDLLQPDE